MTEKFPVLSLGMWLLVANLLFIVGQILLLRCNFKLIQLLQIPLSVLFGYFTDFGVWVVQDIPNGNYYVKLILLMISIIVIGFGVALGGIANVILNSPEAFMRVITEKNQKRFWQYQGYF